MRAISLLVLFLFSSLLMQAQELDLPEYSPGCNETSVVLDAGPGFDSYEWSTGETSQSITVDTEGMYSVTVTTAGGFQSDETEVVFLDYMLTPDEDLTVCPGEELVMNVVPETYDVLWSPGNVNNDTLIIYPAAAQSFEVMISEGGATCVESFTLTMHPQLNVEIEQINEICYGTCDGQVIASVSGGAEPYQYLWNDETVPWDSIATGLCPGENNLQIFDDNQCTLDTNFVIDALPAAEVETATSPTDTLYLENPTLTFSFENISDSEITEWMWVFETPNTDTLLDREVEYTFGLLNELDNLPGSLPVFLEVTNEFGCDTIVALDIPLQEAELKIPNVMTPNGDGLNDIFHVQNEKTGNDIRFEYISVELYVYNRYGKVVYKDDNYQNDWKAEGLSDGTYFYVLRTNGYYRDDEYQGAITILGSQY